MACSCQSCRRPPRAQLPPPAMCERLKLPKTFDSKAASALDSTSGAVAGGSSWWAIGSRIGGKCGVLRQLSHGSIWHKSSLGWKTRNISVPPAPDPAAHPASAGADSRRRAYRLTAPCSLGLGTGDRTRQFGICRIAEGLCGSWQLASRGSGGGLALVDSAGACVKVTAQRIHSSLC